MFCLNLLAIQTSASLCTANALDIVQYSPCLLFQGIQKAQGCYTSSCEWQQQWWTIPDWYPEEANWNNKCCEWWVLYHFVQFGQRCDLWPGGQKFVFSHLPYMVCTTSSAGSQSPHRPRKWPQSALWHGTQFQFQPNHLSAQHMTAKLIEVMSPIYRTRSLCARSC